MSNKSRRGGLGRGLGALIPTSPPGSGAESVDDAAGPSDEASSLTVATSSTESSSPTDATQPAADTTADAQPHAGGSTQPPAQVPGARLLELAVTAIRPNARQPRDVFDDDALAELTHSIREFGILQPVVVRPADDTADGDTYELVMGERRLRAAVAAGLRTIPAIVRGTTDDAMLRDALLENIHRVALNPLEEAAAYQQLLSEFGVTHDELAQRLGRSRPQVSNTIRLLNLPVAVQRRVAAGVLSAGHARALLGLDDRDTQDELAGRIVAEGLSVRATEELVALAQRADPQRPVRRATGPRITAPAVTQLADQLSDVFETRVKVDIGRRKGRITVEFASIDDLERIVSVMAPDIAESRRQRTG